VKPLVSILIPAYNAERWITATINSALGQSWDRKEVIVVDDGSKDKTLEVARRLESKLVKVVGQQNGGACAARNTALTFAQGDYIQWLDADDLLAPDKIAAQLNHGNALPDPKTLLTSAWGRFYFRTERATYRPDSMWADLRPVDWFLRKFEDGVWMNPGAWLVSRELTQVAGPWDLRLAVSGDDDGEYMCRLVAHSNGVQFARTATAFYRVGNGGLSWRRSDTALDAFFLATRLCIDHLRGLEDSERTRAASLAFLQARLRYFYRLKPAIVDAARSLAAGIGGTLNPPATSRQFRLVSSIVGWEKAMQLKNGLWTADVLCRRSLDRAFDLMYRSLPLS
jgi:glycosyltransferase involved in cell wall biosynthesis